MRLHNSYQQSVFSRTPMGKFALGLAILCQSYSISVFAADSEIQPLTDIQQSIEQFVVRSFPSSFRIDTQVGKLDPRLRLARCEQPLEAFYPVSARKIGPTTIGVRCLSNTPWQIYFPVQIKAFGPAVVSKRALMRGSIIVAKDLAVSTRELSDALNGYYTAIEDVAGMELRFNLAGGSIIGPRSLKPQFLVKRGDIITILAETNGLQIRVKGTALMDGFKGQSIRIKNTRSKRELQGEVVASRTVKIDL